MTNLVNFNLIGSNPVEIDLETASDQLLQLAFLFIKTAKDVLHPQTMEIQAKISYQLDQLRRELEKRNLLLS